METTKKAVTCAIIAGLLVLLDGIIVNIIGISGSFVWVSFINWTIFLGATVDERLRAIPGYIVGFLLAISIMRLGSFFNTLFDFTIFNVALSSILATVIINFLCMYFEKLKKFYLNSINGIFVGLGMTFSSLGIGLTPNSYSNIATMLFIIIVYGILGLLSGYITLKITSKK